MKLIDIITTASANTFRSKLRTSLTIVAIFIGAFTLTLTNGLGLGINKYIDKELGSVGPPDTFIITPASDDSGSSSDPKKYDPTRKTSSVADQGNRSVTVLTQSDLDKIKATSGITSAEAIQNANVDYISGQSGDKYVTSIAQFANGTRVTLLAGKSLSNTATTPEVLLPEPFVKTLGYQDAAAAIGKTVKFGITNSLGKSTEVKATIVGVNQKTLISEGGINVDDALLTQLRTIQNVGLPATATNSFSDAIATYDASLSTAGVTDLKDRLKKSGYTAQTIQDRIGTLKTVINGIIAVLNGFAVIALLAASFGIINTLLMSVQERTKEIGLMKAMGMGGGKIFLLFSLEAMILGFWGSAIGSAVAIGAGTIANHIATTTFLKDLEGLHLLAFTPLSVAVIIGIVMVIAFLAGTLPAIRAARQSPIDSLRYE